MNGYEKRIKQLLTQHGWYCCRRGKGSHEIWRNKAGNKVTVNHICKSRFTANTILKQAGINQQF